ncbi:hypothetical protein LTR08_009281 [Meristemomyces frigidus]|nr:hypothetical protein LTR08_009281 [Meristemomyces frigidus]
MPPKPPSSPSSSSFKKPNTKAPSKPELDAISAYLAQKPSFSLDTAKQPFLLERKTTDHDRKLDGAVRASLELARRGREEDEVQSASGGIMDQVAKESKDSTASSHPMHQAGGVDGRAGGKATVQDHHGTPGPVISQDLGEVASKEESRKRAEELNK